MKLLQRIAIAYRYIRYGKNIGMVMACGKCGGTYIRRISDKPQETRWIDENHHIDLIWTDLSRCMHCGAVCWDIQGWNFEGDPGKISAGFVKKE